MTVSVILHGQMLDNSSGETFGDRPFFNTDFIKNNHIKSIKGYFSTKVNLDIIRPTNDIYVYQFDRAGRLTTAYETKYGDTTITQYTYDYNNQVTVIRKSDKYGFHSYHFKYDSLSRIIFKEYRRDLNKNQDLLHFELDKTYRISSESFSYEDTPIGLKKKYYNSKGIHYKTEFIYTNENGFLTGTSASLINGNGRFKTSLTYGDKGLLAEKKTENHLMKKTTSTYRYEYDENQNILAQHYYRNGNYTTEFQIVYDSKTMLLNAVITRDVKTNFMTILKFSDYTFYE